MSCRLPLLLGPAPGLVFQADEEGALCLRLVRASVREPALALDDRAQRRFKPAAFVVVDGSVMPHKASHFELGM
eukprot:5465192-Prymnesium_polylepis.1